MGGEGRSGFGPGVLIISLLALAGVGLPHLGGAPPAPGKRLTASARSRGAQREGEEYPKHSAIALLQNFFDTNKEQFPTNKEWLEDNQPLAPVNEGWEVRFLIASVPDPNSDPLRHQYDADMDAIEAAAQQAGYVLDSFDLPWQEQHKDRPGEVRLATEIDAKWEASPSPTPAATPSPTPTVKPILRPSATASPSYTLKVTSKDETRSDDPGMILFRSGSHDLLLVFVVGETPTRGINKTAMRDALDEVAWLSGWRGNSHGLRVPGLRPQENEVRIIGPAYSGTALSMRETLQQWLDSLHGRKPSIIIRSGSATAVRSTLVDSSHPRGEIDRLGNYQTLRVPDKEIQKRILRYFQSTHNRIAFLGDSTVYGGAYLPPPDAESGSVADSANVVNLLFPLHISKLRGALDYRGQARNDTIPDLRRHNLPLSDDENDQRYDVIPSLSPRSAAYDELMLDNLLATIRRERIHIVGIAATDPEDLVFLVHEIRSECPNTMIFTTTSDLRFVHSEVNDDLLGTIVFSTYPLFGLSQEWAPSLQVGESQLQFPGEDAEGVFNATLTQIHHDGDLIDYSFPPQEHSRCLNKPALWMSIVGRHDLWPTQYWSDAACSDSTVYGRKYLPDVDTLHFNLSELFPSGFVIAYVLIVAATVTGCLGAVAPALVSNLIAKRGAPRTWTAFLFDDVACKEYKREHAWRAWSFVLALFVTYLVAAWFFLIPIIRLTRHPTRWPSLDLSLLAIFGSLGSVPFAVALFRSYKRSRKLPAPAKTDLHPTSARMAFVASSGAVLLVGWFLTSASFIDWRFLPFMFLRAANLGDGVSVLTPLI